MSLSLRAKAEFRIELVEIAGRGCTYAGDIEKPTVPIPRELWP